MSPLLQEQILSLPGKSLSTRLNPSVDETELSLHSKTQSLHTQIQSHDEELVSKAQKSSRLERCFPWGNHPQNNWKPLTLKAPILGSFILVSLSIIVLLEIFSRQSMKKSNGGGIAFASADGNIPPAVSFGFLYLPTILAVFYSMIWSWVDLDVKRLEPWFQLSRINGAEGKDSILLQYPFDFLPFIPMAAFRRKHWGVFFAGTIMLMIFWVITPLQSSIFTTGTVTRILSVDISTTSTLVPVIQQNTSLTMSFLNTAYGISWVNQSLPVFTTAEWAVLPFGPVTKSGTALPTETWTTTRNVFGTTLNCTPAEFTFNSFGYTFSNGRGCIVPDIVLTDTGSTGYMVNYIGYFNDPNLDWALQNPNCSVEFSNSFLALWASSSSRISQSTYNNLTALFCETQYHIQEYSVTVNASNYAVANGQPTGLNNTVSENIDAYINTTAFEYILGTADNLETLELNLPDTFVMNQSPRLQDYDIAFPVTNMVGFAIALNPGSVADLAVPSALKSAFERAHQLLFTTAFASLTQPIRGSTSMQSTFNGTIQDTPGAIVLVRPVAITVEAGLLVVSILTILLWHYTFTRRSHLKFDPSSISDINLALKLGGIPFHEFDALEDVTIQDMGKALIHKRYQLLDPDERALYPDSGLTHSEISNVPRQFFKRVENSKTTWPKELHMAVGISFITIIALSITFLVVLYIRASNKKGLVLPSRNPVVLSIIENYIPTVFATFLEPMWVILNRILCLLVPFEELRRGNARSSTTIEARYTSLPPQFVIWRAIRSGHFILSAVCAVAVSTNVLAVALSTLLNEDVTQVSFPATSTFSFIPQMSGNFKDGNPLYLDHFYVMLSNLTHNTSLPVWIDQSHYYLPFDLTPPPAISQSISPAILNGFQAQTIGIGVNVTCQNLTPGADINGVQFSTSADGLTVNFSTTHELPNGKSITCGPLNPAFGFQNVSIGRNDLPNGRLAMEIMQSMFPPAGVDDEGFCSSLLIAGWLREQPVDVSNSEAGDQNSTTLLGDLTSTFVACNAKLQVASFHLSVDTSGYVLRSSRTSDFATDTDQFFAGNSSQTRIIQQAVSLIAADTPGLFAWHDTNFTSDWMNSLLVIIQNSQNLVDPLISPPNPETLIPQIEGLYEQLFALLLGLNTQIFAKAPTDNRVEAEAIANVSKLFVAPLMFEISIAILSIHLLVAIMYYSNRPKKFLPRMPTSIAAVMSYISSSCMVDASIESGKHDSDTDQRYAFGRFIGIDGRSHVGIEKQRYVVPLKSKNPEVRRRRWKLWLKEDEKEPRTWI